MNKEELIAFLRENLRLEYEISGGQYGSRVIKEVKLMLGDEQISIIELED